MPKSKPNGVCQECGLPGCDLCPTPRKPAEPPPEAPAPGESAELRWIRARHEAGVCRKDDVDTLLHMVDELREQRDAYVSASARFCDERDELRAKLAEAEQFERDERSIRETTDIEIVELAQQLEAAEAKLAATVGWHQEATEWKLTAKTLEAKLAEAEAGAEELANEFDRERKRAQVAEARLKELEEQVDVVKEGV